jgi:hypothetical protein
VDVKAFITVRVEAPNRSAARAAADEFVEACDPEDPFIHRYNSFRTVRPVEPHTVLNSGGFVVDGSSEVERVCSECDEIFEDPAKSPVCQSCLDDREPEEPPLDTPSLDTSFHDHEMDV